jgi:sugar phosphate isomerase/epimerase
MAGGALSSGAPNQGLPSTLFAFDNGTGRDQKVPLMQQAAMLKRTGYAGMGVYTGTERIPEMLAALDRHGLRLLSIYVHSSVADTGARIDPGIPTAIRQLAGRDTMLMLTVQGHQPKAEERAVENVREVASMAGEAGLRVCLYPHVNFYVETTPDALRIIRKVERDNVGAALNFHHTLLFHSNRCGEDDIDVRPMLRRGLRHIWMASVNGIRRGEDWRIVTLDDGDVDVSSFVQALQDAGYQGPVGLQCYRVLGDIEHNLNRSMIAWRRLVARTGRSGTAPL